MIPENNDTVREQIIERCLALNKCLKQLQELFNFDDLDDNSFEKQYMELLVKIAELNYTNYQTIKKLKQS